jgi:hypothetical protein
VLCLRAAVTCTVPPLPLRDVALDNEGGARSMSDTMSSAIPTVNMDDIGGGGSYTLCTQLIAYVCRECVCSNKERWNSYRRNRNVWYTLAWSVECVGRVAGVCVRAWYRQVRVVLCDAMLKCSCAWVNQCRCAGCQVRFDSPTSLTTQGQPAPSLFRLHFHLSCQRDLTIDL